MMVPLSHKSLSHPLIGTACYSKLYSTHYPPPFSPIFPGVPLFCSLHCAFVVRSWFALCLCGGFVLHNAHSIYVVCSYCTLCLSGVFTLHMVSMWCVRITHCLLEMFCMYIVFMCHDSCCTSCCHTLCQGDHCAI